VTKALRKYRDSLRRADSYDDAGEALEQYEQDKLDEDRLLAGEHDDDEI